MCLRLRNEYDSLSKERIWTEWWKWATDSIVPSYGLCFLEDAGWLDLYPALFNLMGAIQDSEWHPEGTVWEHILFAVDIAAKISDREQLSIEDRGILILTALLHDVGKPATTERCADGRIRAKKHCKNGVPIAEQFLLSIGACSKIIKKILPLIRDHMVHVVSRPIGKRLVRRLANRLQPATIAELLRVIEADYSARPPLPEKLPLEAERLKQISDELCLNVSAPKPLLLGRHLIEYLHMNPGPEFSPILKAGFQAQLDGAFNTTTGAIEWVKYYAKC